MDDTDQVAAAANVPAGRLRGGDLDVDSLHGSDRCDRGDACGTEGGRLRHGGVGGCEGGCVGGGVGGCETRSSSVECRCSHMSMLMIMHMVKEMVVGKGIHLGMGMGMRMVIVM